MAIVQRGSKVYATIKDLPVVTAISDGMKFIMQGDEGTILADYADLSIDLDHTTFGQTFMDMVNLTGTIEEFVTEVESKITDFENSLTNMETKVEEHNADIEALKYFVRLIALGPEKENAADEDAAKEKFGENTPEFNAWKEIYDSLRIKDKEVTEDSFFATYNLVS